MFEVTAGIILKEDKILIAKRGLDKKFRGRWEFPGGKLEPGESLQDCIKRELEEELNISIKNQEYFITNEHEYDNFKVKIHSFLIREYNGEIILNEHEELKWINPNKYEEYDILEADLPFIRAFLKK
jgi:8-oxo-dGTP diphosphatase